MSLISTLLVSVCLARQVVGNDLGLHPVTLFSPTLEWSVDNPSHSGNVFDVDAKVTFVHSATGMTRVTRMFYDGGTTWRFRFTGTWVGTWTFSSVSSDSDLDGITGSVEVSENSDASMRGFIVASGTRFARQSGGNGETEGYLHNVFQDEFELRTSAIWSEGLSRWSDLALTHALLDQVELNGMDTMEIELEHQILQIDAARHTEHSSEEPDLATFRIVESMIALAHQRGHTVRLFMWGDESRKMTPAGLSGGINGPVDQRLQRYIGARLGPLPGWTMNYGFDLEEWVSESEVSAWGNYLGEHMGWPHLLAARKRSGSGISLDANDETPDSGFYDVALEQLDGSGGRPVVFDRRFIYLRDGVWDMETTRRALWQFTLAGGAGAVWGREEEEYPSKQQLRTHFTFWHEMGRFGLDLERAPDTSDAWSLRSSDGERSIVYKEDADAVQIHLSEASSPHTAIAVDTKLAYAELRIGLLEPGSRNISLPYTSDWVIETRVEEEEPLPAMGVFGPMGLVVLGTLLLGSCPLHPRRLPEAFTTDDGGPAGL